MSLNIRKHFTFIFHTWAMSTWLKPLMWMRTCHLLSQTFPWGMDIIKHKVTSWINSASENLLFMQIVMHFIQVQGTYSLQMAMVLKLKIFACLEIFVRIIHPNYVFPFFKALIKLGRGCADNTLVYFIRQNTDSE